MATTPSGSASLLERGLLALQHGQLSEARKDLEQASRSQPQNAYVWSSLAETYLRLKLPERAAAAAKLAGKTGGKDPVVWHALAMYYSESGQPGQAAGWEQRFAESPNADRDALTRAASLYLAAGDAEQAVKLARQAVSQASTPEREDLLGEAFIRAGQADEGEKHLALAWEQSRTDPHISFDLGQALLRREEFTRAADVLDSALSVHRDDPQLTLALGVARYGQRRFDDALLAFLRVIQVDPTIEQPYVFLGRMLEQAGAQLASIISAYDKWAAREPSNPKAQLLLAKALLAQDHGSKRAEALLRHSIALDANDWEAHYELGALLENMHDYAGAASELKRSIELRPQEPLPHYHLARVYDRLGESAQAAAERLKHQRLTAPKTP